MQVQGKSVRMVQTTMSGSSMKSVVSRCPALSAASQSRCRLHVQAGGIWTPRNTSPHNGASIKQDLRPKGYDRPWITANQPQLAPRTPEMSGDPFSLLLRQRTIFLGGEVEDFSADAIISQLLLLDSQDPTKPIKLFINSPGGSVTAGMGIYDAINLCKTDVETYCFGLAASMGAFLLGAGKIGKRHSMPNARIMIHQPLGGASGQAVDIEIQAKEIMYHKANLNRIIADYTGQPVNKIEEDTDRDRYMSPLEAKEYGIIDHIIGGEEAVFNIRGSTKRFPKVKDSFVTDIDDMVNKNVMDGDPFMMNTPSWRFNSPNVEPHTRSLAEGEQWFTVHKVSKEDYKEMVDEHNAAEVAQDIESTKRSVKDRIDSAW